MFLSRPSFDSPAQLSKRFMKHQVDWIMAEDPIKPGDRLVREWLEVFQKLRPN